MHETTRFGIPEETSGVKAFSVLEISLDEKTRKCLEAIAKREGKILSELVESIVVAKMAPASEDHDAPSHAREGGIADEWEKITNEILRLESMRRKFIQLAGQQGDSLSDPGERLPSLLESHDRKIRECEERLENLTAGCRKRAAVVGLLADYYDR